MVEYRHRLNLTLLAGLRRIQDAGGGPINLSKLDLTRNQWDNFQKLRYWEVVRQVEVNGSRKKGVWEITPLGSAFLMERTTLPVQVWTYRGTTVRQSERQTSLKDIRGWCDRREHYNEACDTHVS